MILNERRIISNIKSSVDNTNLPVMKLVISLLVLQISLLKEEFRKTLADFIKETTTNEKPPYQ